MSEFRKKIERAVADAAASGQSYGDILADLSTVVGCMVAASSKERPIRLAHVKASMAVISAVIDGTETPRHDPRCQGKVPPSQGLRFALAFLYAVGDRRKEYFDREPYDEFWRVATMEDAGGAGSAGYGRRQHLYAPFEGIARAAGVPAEPDVLARIKAARGTLGRQTKK